MIVKRKGVIVRWGPEEAWSKRTSRCTRALSPRGPDIRPEKLGITRSMIFGSMAVLEGRAASDFSIQRSPLLPGTSAGLPPIIPSGLPADLLEGWPDRRG